ncbi:uncharacterized protein [Hetaerina americana]|uniref:uncharacterized protein n=1 Tax=Hetaerina americana TaxID=62018 RepID=UPI003A7F13E8
MDPLHELTDHIRKEDLILAIRRLTGETEILLSEVVDVKRATSGIEGFTSTVVRVHASYRVRGDSEEHRVSFVAKTAPLEESQMEIVKSCRVFIREGVYFTEIVPLMLKASAGRVELPLPVCYHAVYDGVNDAIYMEDLGAKGFRTPRRTYQLDGLDLDHCIVALKNLGRLHALAFAAERLLPKEKGSILKIFPDLAKDAVIYDRKPGQPQQPYQGMVERGLEVVLMISKQLEGLPKKAEATGILGKVLEGLWPTLKRLIEPRQGGINILTHGDYWLNNIMFRYGVNGVTPVEAKIIDFQVARYCHPAVDVINFMYISTRRPMRDKHFDMLVNEYYNSMVETLSALDQPIPISLVDFKLDLFGVYRTFGVIVSAAFLPLMMLGEDFVPSNADEMTKEKYEDFFKTGCSSLILQRYASDSNYRSKVEVELREFIEVILPDGLDSIESSPLMIS